MSPDLFLFRGLRKLGKQWQYESEGAVETAEAAVSRQRRCVSLLKPQIIANRRSRIIDPNCYCTISVNMVLWVKPPAVAVTVTV